MNRMQIEIETGSDPPGSLFGWLVTVWAMLAAVAAIGYMVNRFAGS